MARSDCTARPIVEVNRKPHQRLGALARVHDRRVGLGIEEVDERGVGVDGFDLPYAEPQEMTLDELYAMFMSKTGLCRAWRGRGFLQVRVLACGARFGGGNANHSQRGESPHGVPRMVPLAKPAFSRMWNRGRRLTSKLTRCSESGLGCLVP